MFSARLDSSTVLLYLLFEHQSANDNSMLLRMLESLVLIWRRYRKENPGEALPLIIPFLVSHAPGGWTGPLSFHDMFDPSPDSVPGLSALVPNFSILLDDLAGLSNEQIEGRTLAAFSKLALWLLRDARDAEALLGNFVAWVETFREALGAPDGMDAVALLLHYISIVSERLNFEDIHDKIREQLPEAEHAAMTIAEQLRQEGLQKGLKIAEQQRQEGRQEGLREGRVHTLEHLLERRFGEVAPHYRAQIRSATIEQLDRYIDRILSAQSLEELFED